MNGSSAIAVVSAFLSILLAACAGPTATPSAALQSTTPASTPAITISPPSAAAPATASPQPSASEQAGCPNPNGGQCLGPLAAGTYSTVTFASTITYTVPAGWANFEDLPGNFLLVPPGSSLAGVDAGTSDYLGIYASIALDGPCAGPAPNIQGAAAMAAYLGRQAWFTTTPPRVVSVGGLSGVVLDIRLAKTWKTTCNSGGPPDAPLMSGVSPANFDHGLGGKLAIRLYLFDSGHDVLAIEVDDVSGGGHLDGYDVVVKSLRLGAG